MQITAGSSVCSRPDRLQRLRRHYDKGKKACKAFSWILLWNNLRMLWCWSKYGCQKASDKKKKKNPSQFMCDLNSELNFWTWNGVRLDFLCTLFFHSLATQPSRPKTHLSSKYTTVRNLNSQLRVGWSFTLSLTTCFVPKLVHPSEALSSVECFHHKFTQNPPQTLYHTIYPLMSSDSTLLDTPSSPKIRQQIPKTTCKHVCL